MKLHKVIGSGILLAALGVVTPTYAQEQHDQDHPSKPEEGKPEDKPKQQAEPPKGPNDQPRSTEREAKPPEEKQARPEKQEAPARQAQQNEHKQTAQQHGRIPEDKYRANFGKEHRFHIGHPTVVEGRPRFEYGGYSFFMTEAWPGGWGYNDYVYIIEISGVYYLVDDAHPGVQLALTIE